MVGHRYNSPCTALWDPR